MDEENFSETLYEFKIQFYKSELKNLRDHSYIYAFFVKKLLLSSNVGTKGRYQMMEDMIADYQKEQEKLLDIIKQVEIDGYQVIFDSPDSDFINQRSSCIDCLTQIGFHSYMAFEEYQKAQLAKKGWK